MILSCSMFLYLTHSSNGVTEMIQTHGNVFPSVLNGAFAQDKYEYYVPLQDFMNPTLKVDRPTNSNCEIDEATQIDIFNFCKRHPGELHKKGLTGWHIKAGFSTGSKMRLSTKKVKRVPRYVKSLFKKRKGRRPYMMVQETMRSTQVSSKCLITKPCSLWFY